MTVLLALLAIIIPGHQCEAVASIWQPDMRGTVVTRGCTDKEMGA